jgi:hypothetical protein
MKLEKKKLKLKRYRLKRSEPDSGEIEILSPVVGTIEDITVPSLLNLDFNLTKNNYLVRKRVSQFLKLVMNKIASPRFSINPGFFSLAWIPVSVLFSVMLFRNNF